MALVVITGGARSGKSTAAQNLAEARLRDGVPVAVAVFGHADDDEMRDRIARHQADRPEGFETLEVTSADLATGHPAAGWLECVQHDGLLVIDCLGTLLGLLMETAWLDFSEGGLGDADAVSLPEGYAERVEGDFRSLVDAIKSRDADTLVVTNEVGAGIVPEWASGRLFRDLLGTGNRALVSAADEAYVVIAGRLLSLADLPTHAAWPVD